MRDLSIRGAGDMLGTEQAGFIDSVGVDLYLDLINEELNGKKEEIDEENTILDNVSTHIDNSYTDEDELIIELHNRINQVTSEEEYLELKKEIIDRFGFIDEKIENYIIQEYVENLLKELNIKILMNDNSKISLRIDNNIYKNLNIEDLFVYSTRINSKFAFIYRNNFIVLSLLKLDYEKHYLYYILEILKYIKNEVNK
jgi:transcription-repair coupling factor (superfamily II helicase)